MIHEDKGEFIKVLERASRVNGFLLPLLEKDYYLTLILSRANELCEDLILRNGFDLTNKEVTVLFKKKLKEDKADTDLEKYQINLGRSDEEIKDMCSRIETELVDVLTPDERKNFDLTVALERINKAMASVTQ